MEQRKNTPPGVEFFWIEADQDGSGEHPLERELGHRLDVLARFQQMIADAQALGRDDMVDELVTQHNRQSQIIWELRSALDRARNGSD